MVNTNQPDFSQLPGQHKSHKAQVVAIIMSILFVCSLAFGIWAFIGMIDNQTNLDEKIATASEVAVQKAESAKEVEFAEREKDPFKTYKGSETYGSLTFKYPKNWSVYADSADANTILDFYAHPNLIPGFKDTNFAFRAQIVDTEYADVLKSFDAAAKKGTVKVKAFRPDKVPGQLGAIIQGEIKTDVQGTIVLLPQRDKTFRLFTESKDYLKDFDRILDSVTFVP